ncbi:MAG: M16 family metallopeptidase [Paludibacteraceae bacterium]
MNQYKQHTLANGLRIVHIPFQGTVSYCGVIINVGSRDEDEPHHGSAHLIEHMLFKGTEKRNSEQIIERLESVGGELNAYTSKEETVVYAAFLKKYTQRAVELIADVVSHSKFPQEELKKEIAIVQDEIESYNDTPAELIFDDFEELLFSGNSMAHNILGTKRQLKSFSVEKLNSFFKSHYIPSEMVFFSLGGVQFDKLVRWCEIYFNTSSVSKTDYPRLTPSIQPVSHKTIKRKTNQVHCLMGGEAYSLHSPDRSALYLLNNILGGPGMSSLLNLSLREKHGLVYSVESIYQPFSDTGWWTVYFGTDPDNSQKCENLIKEELKKLCENKISDKKLKQYKIQLSGQMAISSENKESTALALGKSIMRYGRYSSPDEVRERINNISAEQLQSVAIEIFDTEKLHVLKYV